MTFFFFSVCSFSLLSGITGVGNTKVIWKGSSKAGVWYLFFLSCSLHSGLVIENKIFNLVIISML